MTVSRLTGVLTGLAVAFSVTPPSFAQAPPAPKLAFEDERPLKLRWPVGETEVVVCNLGNAATSATVALLGFDFRISDEPVDTERVLNVSPAAIELDAGKCVVIRLERLARAPDAGEYEGVLVIRDAATIVRRVISVSGRAIHTTAAAAAVEEVALVARRDGLWDDSVSLEEPASIPLVGSRRRMVVPKPGTTIGVLQNGKHRARVVVAGTPDGRRNRRVLPIRLDAPGQVGTYSGTVDLGLGRDQAAPVKLKVEASDSKWFAVAAVLLGLLLAALTTFYLQKTQPRWHLRRRRKKLGKRYRDAKRAFDERYGTSRFKDYRPDEDDIARHEDKIKQSGKRYAKDNLLVDRDSDDFNALVRMLQTAEADAELFADGFGAKLTELEEAVESFRGDYPDSVPLFIDRAASRLNGQRLPVGGATSIVVEVDAYLKLAREWRTMAELVKRLEAWVEALREAGLDDRERARLEEAAAKVEEAKMEMIDAVDAESLETSGAKSDLRRAYSVLAALGSRHGVWIPPADEVAGRPVGITTMSWVDNIPDELAELIERSKLRPVAGLAVDVLERSVKSFADLGVLAFAVVAAILVGLPTVITDETFGSWQDYVAAFGLGAAAGAATKALYETAAQLQRHERVTAK